MVVLMGFVLGKRFRWYRMRCGARTLGVATGEEAWELYVNMWDMKKGWLASLWTWQSPFFIRDRIGAIVGTPRMYLVAMFALGL